MKSNQTKRGLKMAKNICANCVHYIDSATLVTKNSNGNYGEETAQDLCTFFLALHETADYVRGGMIVENTKLVCCASNNVSGDCENYEENKELETKKETTELSSIKATETALPSPAVKLEG
jgi:hypothetical protein